MAEDRQRWQICFDKFAADDERRREALLALGNGVLSMRASAPEAAAVDSDSAVHYAGFYRDGWYDDAPREVNGQKVRIAALVNLPNPFGLSVSLDGKQWLDSGNTPRLTYRQCLRMDRGRLQRQVDFTLGEKSCRLHETRFLSMATPRLAVLRWALDLPPGVDCVYLRAVLDGSIENRLVKTNHAYEGARLFELNATGKQNGQAALSACLAGSRHRVAIAVETRCGGAELQWSTRWDNKRLTQEAECPVAGARKLVIEKRVLVSVDGELPDDPASAHEHVLRLLPHEAFARLCIRHDRAWRRLWAAMPLRLSDPDHERTLHLHAFHLLQTISPHSRKQDLGFPARGWHEGYYGQVFWDELFAYPFLSSHFPALARQLLRYRHRRLDEARERARVAGWRGAMFPWRSADSGAEETPPFQCNPLSGRWMPDHTQLQRHIGAAIAYDAWQLYLTTGDEALLAGEGGDLILEIARFWASIARWDDVRGRFVIRGVIGPDEYHNLSPNGQRPGLDDNAYTNLMAAWTLHLGLEVLDVLPHHRAQALCKRLGITPSERVHWREISRKMYLPIRSDGVLAQFDDVDPLKPAPAEWRHDDRPRLDWLLAARGDRTDRYRLSKQPDVLMLPYLFSPVAIQALGDRVGYTLDETALRQTIDHHLSTITHESSLSTVVCAGALAHFDTAASWHYFQQSMGVDLMAPADGGTLEGVHLGAMAGSLDVLQRHYLGISPARDALHVFPRPPAALGDVELAVLFRRARLHFKLNGSALLIRSETANAKQAFIRHTAGTTLLQPGDTLRIRCDRP